MRFQTLLVCLLITGCHHTPATGGGTDMAGSHGGDGGVNSSCVAPAGACKVDGDCCVGSCDPTSHSCIIGGGGGGVTDGGVVVGGGGCLAQGVACTSGVQCCGLSCVNGKCGGACTQDGNACTANTDCCGGNCVSGKCQPILAGACKTDNNACTMNSNCCSGNCKGGTCITTAAGCQPLNDVCYAAGDCCSGVCTIPSGKMAGTCTALATMGNCAMDGEVCPGCNACCSRVCAGTASGASVCQLAGGCRIMGDTCTKDADCCGAAGSGLPGAGTVTCQIVAGTNPKIGFCTTPTASGGAGNSCDPEGDVCNPMPRLTCGGSAREDCCDCTPPKYNCCKLDKEGVPRCYGGGMIAGCPTGYTGVAPCCIAAGAQCTFSGECCGGAPCVPDSMGVLRCGSSACATSGQVCTANSDCCVGLQCNVPAGKTSGTCGSAPPPPPPTGDMGTITPVGDGGTCSLVGQSCSATQPCCPGSNCSNSTGQPCAATDTGCTCFGVIL